MRILQVIPYFYPAWSFGGPLKVVYELSKQLVKRGHKVTVFTSDVLDAHSKVKCDKLPEMIEDIKVYYFKNLSFFTLKNFKMFITPQLIRYVKKQIKSFDVIHLHEYRSVQNIIVYHYAKKYGIPYVVQGHGSDSPALVNMQKYVLKKIFDYTAGHRILRNASRVLTLNKTETEQYIKRGVKENRIEIVSNGICLSDYDDNLPAQNDFKKQWSIGNDEKIILYVGRITRYKGIDMAVKAFAHLENRIGGCRLVIVGPDDGYLENLKKLVDKLKITDKILITGPLPERDKLQAYVDADVFITPCFEGFPLTFVEACTCKVPIVTTNKADKLEWIDKVGLSVTYAEEDLEKALYELLTNDNQRKELGEAGRKLVEERFTWEKIIKHVEKIYEDCIKEG